MGQKEEAKKEGGEKKGGDAAVKKEEKPTAVVLKADLHCEGCAKKVRRSIRHFDGVEDVKTDWESGKLTVKGNVDPAWLRDILASKIKKKVEILSPQPKKDGGGGGGAAGDKKSDDKSAKKDEKDTEKKPKEPQVSTVVLTVRLHCDGCADKVKRIIRKINGVKDVDVDLAKDLVTVKGSMDVKEITAYLREKLKRGVEVVPSKKDGGEGEKKKMVDDGEKKEKKEKGGGSESSKVEANKMEYHGFQSNTFYARPIYNQSYYNQDYGLTMSDPSSSHAAMGYSYPYAHAPPPYMHVPPTPPPTYVHAPSPNMFSDEDPNACSVM
ncbi:heavy metal-associated isoprenylated plant protein 6 [Ipomoea triloba]|uniref:heavy metal-associated isoprenylated plant protein 6 n=1 Tax=Ipomoea triloba TaxID=35885 RepID=UPI00125E503F|nr:heavy metal-associated isoprenylated plant protein 6 [Ipomoea triloba]